jgi:putative tricarboxylic transport membrane protein
MDWKDRFSAVFIIFFSGVTIYLALKLPFGKIGKPGPGFFPFVLSVIIGLLALILFLKSHSNKKPESLTEEKFAKWKVLYLLGSLCLYASLFRPAGFLISTSIFLITLKPIVAKKWVPVLLGSIFISLIFFFFFDYLLKVELPMGILAK